MKEKIFIAGAGIGGLATALRLSAKGYQVEIVEKNKQAGGRLNRIVKDGFTFDTGPSFFSMSYEFKQFAEECGIELPFSFIELDPLYTVSFKGNDRKFTLYKDIDKFAAQFEDIEPNFKQKLQRYLKKCSQLYNDTVDVVIKTNFDSIPDYLFSLLKVNPVHLPQLVRTFWQQVNHYFDSKEARQIISLIAFFLGRTPFDTSAVYTLLSHIEFVHDGYYNVNGGMYQITEGILGALEKAGVKIHFNTEITGIQSSIEGKVTALTDQNGKKWTSDVFVINSDAAYFRGKVLKRKKYSIQNLQKMDWTMGYLTIYLGINCKLPQVDHHNYYLGNNFEEYAMEMFQRSDMPETPYYYVNVLSKYNKQCAPEGCESLFFVCPVPNLLYKTDWSDKNTIVDNIILDFGKKIGQDISKQIISQTVYTPLDWQNRFNLFMGSGLGLSHKMSQIGAFRPSNKDEKFTNLFYVGASTVPGAGLPMAIISSKLAAERIINYFKEQ